MPVSIDEVRHIARLARLRFDADEEERLAREMSAILEHMETLNELHTTDVEPMSHALDLANVTRPDVAERRITREQALSNAPDSDGTFFRVPKVIE